MKHPSFSIIIATRNRPAQLKRCINSLLDLDANATPFELLIVNDGGTPPELEGADKTFRKFPITIINQPRIGPSAARNVGAARAAGEWLAFMDDDCTPARDWLRQLAVHACPNDNCALGGRVVNGLRDDRYAATSQLLFEYLYIYYHSGNYRPVHPPFFTTNNLAVSRARFDEIGGFDVRLYAAEDRDFCARWQEQEHRLCYVPSACVHHWHSLTFRTFLRQHWRYGRGNFLFQQQRAARGFEAFRLEPLPFYLDLLRYPFKTESGGRALRLALLLTLAQLSNLRGFITQSLSREYIF